jgi:NodT family efflux transporter outer membrane factor (OMF) lipoprotein
LRSFQSQLGVARRNLAVQQDALGLTRARYAGGLASELDVARVEAQVAITQSQIPQLETSCKEAVHRLGVLLNETPGALSGELATPTPIPVAPSEIPADLPADVLRQRPDVRRAERQVAAATARVGVATADLYPRVFLLGGAGLDSLAASDFFSADSETWTIGPSISWPIFRAGQIVASIKVHDAQEQQALISYRQAILNALEEVENALVAYTRERSRGEDLAKAVASNKRALTLASQLYTSGLSDFLNVLDAQRSLFQTESEQAQSKAATAVDLVALHKALGGGWEAFAPGQLASSSDSAAPFVARP